MAHKKEFNLGAFIHAPKNHCDEQQIMSSWNEMEKPFVSIHCLTFNHEGYIADAIEGFLIQETNFPFEILIHDDASTDNTQDVIRKYQEKFPNIIKPFYQSENHRSKGCRTGIYNFYRTLGKYIALCEGDDFWFDPKKLQKQVDFMEKNPTIVMCGHDVVETDLSRKIIRKPYFNFKSPKIFSQRDIALGLMNLPSKSSLVRADLPVPSVGMPWGDTALFSFYGNWGKACIFNEVMAVYRRHDGGVWSRLNRKQQLDAHFDIFSRIPRYTNDKYKSLSLLRLYWFLSNNKSELGNDVDCALAESRKQFFKSLTFSNVYYLAKRFLIDVAQHLFRVIKK